MMVWGGGRRILIKMEMMTYYIPVLLSATDHPAIVCTITLPFIIGGEAGEHFQQTHNSWYWETYKTYLQNFSLICKASWHFSMRQAYKQHTVRWFYFLIQSDVNFNFYTLLENKEKNNVIRTLIINLWWWVLFTILWKLI